MLFCSVPGKACLAVYSSVSSIHRAGGKGIDRGMIREYNRIHSSRPGGVVCITPLHNLAVCHQSDGNE